MQKVSVVWKSILLILFVCGSVNARPVIVLDLPKAIEEADCIVIGEIVDRVHIKSGADPINRYSVLVEETLKGKDIDGELIKFDTWRGLPFIKQVLCFLKKTESGYAPWNSDYPHIALSSEQLIPKKQAGNVMDRVRWELCNNLASDSSNLLESTLDLFLDNVGRELLSREEIDIYLLPLTESRNDRTSVLAFSVLVEYGYTDCIPAALKLIEEKGSGDSNTSFGALYYAIRQADVPEKYLDMIGRFVDSEDERARYMASYVLRMSKSKRAVPYLVSATYDSDIKVRYNAIMGLAQIHSSGRELTATVAIFEQDESKYIKYWQEKYPEYK